MRSIVKSKPTPGLWMEDSPIPSIGDNDVLIKIQQTGICGTDLHIFNWNHWASNIIKPPLILGHEFFGLVEDMGKNVSHVKIGARVSGESHITCGMCRNCRAGKRHLCPNTKGIGIQSHGAFAEYLCLPAENVYVIPDDITDEVAAILDPLGNSAHTALNFNMVGEDIIITGAGPIGIMATAIAKHVGARNIVITDINDYRLSLAKKMGATKTVNINNSSISDTIHELNMVSGFDIGLEVSGNISALNSMIKNMYPGGKIALLGIPSQAASLDLHPIIFHELTIKGIYGREMFETWYKVLSMLQSGLNISSIITHHFPADDFEKAFKLAESGKCGKIILDW